MFERASKGMIAMLVRIDALRQPELAPAGALAAEVVVRDLEGDPRRAPR